MHFSLQCVVGILVFSFVDAALYFPTDDLLKDLQAHEFSDRKHARSETDRMQPGAPQVATAPASSSVEIEKKTLKTKKYNKTTLKNLETKTKFDNKRVRRDLNDNQLDHSDFARTLDQVIKLTAPRAHNRLQSIWKRLRSMLSSSRNDGSNGERADELTKALFQQLFKQFDLPNILRKRADKLRRRVGPSGNPTANNATEAAKEENGVRVVDFRKKETDNQTKDGSGDQQIQQWIGAVADSDKNIAQKEKIETDAINKPAVSTVPTTTSSPSTSTKFPQLSLFQRRKGPVQVAVKIPQKHAKSGIKRFSPAQGKETA